MSAALVLAVLAGNAAAAGPQATARKLLTTCEGAANSLPIVALEANTPRVPKANRRAQDAFYVCGDNSPWLKLNLKSRALHQAYHAWDDLSSGLGDYLTYCEDVTFGRTDTSLLHDAQHDLTRAREEAKRALAKL